MSLVHAARQRQFESAYREVARYLVEKAIFHWIDHVLQDLRRNVASGKVTPDRAKVLWNLNFLCYRCCRKAVKEGRLPCQTGQTEELLRDKLHDPETSKI